MLSTEYDDESSSLNIEEPVISKYNEQGRERGKSRSLFIKINQIQRTVCLDF